MEEKVVTAKTFEALNDLYEKAKLQLKDLKNDGDKSDKPYFESVILFINELLQNMKDNHASFGKLMAMKASLLFEQGKILFLKSDLSLALEALNQSLDTIKDLKENPHFIYLYNRILNHYSYLLAKNSQYELARDYLEDSIKFYKSVSSKSAILVYSTDDLFHDNYLLKGNNVLKFEKLITNNYQMLAWICHKQDAMDFFLIYHHTVLKRQLETQDGQAYNWVFRAARLASYFCGINRFKEARHLLLAANAVLQEYELDVLKYRKAPHFSAEWDNLQRYYADLGKHWVKYALSLFTVSRGKAASTKTNEQLLEDLLTTSLSCINVTDLPSEDRPDGTIHETSPDKQEKEEPDGGATLKAHTPLSSSSPIKPEERLGEPQPLLLPEPSPVDAYDFSFPSLDLRQKEATVSASEVRTPEEARALFMLAQEWIRRAKNFYNIRDHTLENINLILDLNELYKHLVAFECDFDSQYGIQKRRSDILEALIAALKEIKPNCYLAVSIELLRELVDVQIDLITLNLKRLCMTHTTSAPNLSSSYQENVRKIESLSLISEHLTRSVTSI